jgi:hypothetical protein
MVNITVLELHLDDATFSVDQPFNTITGSKETGGEETDEQADGQSDSDDEETAPVGVDDGPAVPTKALAAVGAVLVLVGVAAALRRFVGGEDPDVEIDTPDDENRPVGVTVDE